MINKVNSMGIWKEIAPTLNNDNVIGLVNSKRIGALDNVDHSSLSDWYSEDPDRVHIGLVDAIQSYERIAFPFLDDLLKKAGRIKVNGIDGSFTYDKAIRTSFGVYTVEDTSTRHAQPGINGGDFDLVLSQDFKPGDVLTSDVEDGQNVYVSNESPVVPRGEGWLHRVKLVKQTKKSWYSADQLVKGVEYFHIGFGANEFTTQFSGFQAVNNTSNVRCEFHLGNHRGVEGTATMYGGSKLLKYVDTSTRNFLINAQKEMEGWGTTVNGEKLDAVAIGIGHETAKGGLLIDQAQIMSGIEWLAFRQHFRLEGLSNTYQQGGVIEDADGVVRLNEGLLPQLKRGTTYSYGRPGGVNLELLQRIVGYAHRDDPKPVDEWVTEITCGLGLHTNIQEVITEHFGNQLQWLAPLRGAEGFLPKNPVSGSLDALKLALVKAGECPLPGCGILRIKHDPSLDVMPLTGVRSRGYHKNGLPRSSYSGYILDYTDPTSTNAYAAKINTSDEVKLFRKGTNLYYVTPENNALNWGFENGRWDFRRTANIVSSNPHMAQTFFCHGASAVWLSDPSRTIYIHLDSKLDTK
jgi:hypothetical protein